MIIKQEENDKFYLYYFKALLRGVLLSVVLLLITSCIFYFSNLNEGYIKTIAWIVTIISVCYASIYASFKIGSKGYLHGAAVGAFYVVIMLLIGLLAEKGHVVLKSYLIMFIMSLVIGALAGMIGITLKG